ncbi:MAG: hypothetical protein ACK5RL_02665 [Acidimicrobiales bacterium]
MTDRFKPTRGHGRDWKHTILLVPGYALVGAVIAWLAVACAQPAGSQARDDDCAELAGAEGEFVVFLGGSESETSAETSERRLQAVAEAIAVAADCEGHGRVVLESNGRLEVLISEDLRSSLNTEVARDHEVSRTVDRLMTELREQLAPYLAEPAAGSNPGVLFRYLDERLDWLPAGEGITATVISDGITNTEAVSLNRPIEEAEVPALAEAVAPAVDLEHRVSLEWRELGVSVDAAPPPETYLTSLTAVWRTVCETRGVATCRISTTAGPGGRVPGRPDQSFAPGVLLLAAAALSRTASHRIGTVRGLLQVRQAHVRRGLALARDAEADRAEYLRRRPDLEARISRPDWLTARVQWLLKGLLFAAEIAAGTAALYTAGDRLDLAILTFAGVSVGTVLAGQQIGLAARRREGEPRRLVVSAVATILLITAMLGISRYFAVDYRFALLAGVTVAVAMGSALLAFQAWDPAHDAVCRGERHHRGLAAAASSELNHSNVQKFERAYASLRADGVEALCDAARESTAPEAGSPEIGADVVDHLMAMVVGPEIRHLIPADRSGEIPADRSGEIPTDRSGEATDGPGRGT